MKFDIVEKFYSLNGEAPSAGKPVYIVRFTGCNLSCVYCDTEYKDEIHFSMTPEELTADIKNALTEYPGCSVLFTGGEPLLGERQSGIIGIIKHFPDTEFFIETNGSILIDDFTLSNVRYVVDWKTVSSGFGNSFALNNLDKLRPEHDCIKIVAAKEDLSDLIGTIKMIKSVNKELSVYVSPQWGNIDLEKLAAFIVDNRLPVSLSLQLHKIIWGNKRGV